MCKNLVRAQHFPHDNLIQSSIYYESVRRYFLLKLLALNGLGTIIVCWQIAEYFTDDKQTAIEFLTLGETVDRKLNKQSHPWHQRIAQHYEALTELFENGPNVALFFLRECD